MPAFALSNGKVIYWTQAASPSVTAAQAYDAWLADLWLSQVPEEDRIYLYTSAEEVALASPFFPGQSSKAFVGSDGALGLYWAAAAGGEYALAYTLPSSFKVYGKLSRPFLLISTRSDGSTLPVASSSARIQKSGLNTLYSANLEQPYGSGLQRSVVAYRVQPSRVDLYVTALDPLKVALWEMQEPTQTDVIIGSQVMLAQSAGTTVHYVVEYADPSVPVDIAGAADTPLGTPAGVVVLTPGVAASAPAVLGAPAAQLISDFSAVLGDVVTTYVMDLITPAGRVRVPIGSWQATLQSGASSYVQCTIPAASAWLESIEAATEFEVLRRAVPPNAPPIEYAMARAPAQTVRFDRGPQRNTCTLSGYVPDLALGSGSTPAVLTRNLSGVRSISSGAGGVRLRCAIDWLLRPGDTAVGQGVSFVVSYLNFYVNNGDAYCDVGERV